MANPGGQAGFLLLLCLLCGRQELVASQRIGFEPQEYTAEEESTLTLTIILENFVFPLRDSISLEIATSVRDANPPATAADLPPITTNIIIPAGYNMSTFLINLELPGDGVRDGTKVFIYRFEIIPNPQNIGRLNTEATITIEDIDDNPIIQLDPSGTVVDDEGMTVRACAILTNVFTPLSGDINSSFVVTFDDLAVSSDVSISSPITISGNTIVKSFQFMVGDANNSMRCIDIQLVADNLLEGNESFTVSLGTASSNIDFSQNDGMFTVIILDANSASVSFVQPSTSPLEVDEGTSTSIGLTLSSSNSLVTLERTLKVTISGSPSGDDYSVLNTLEIPSGTGVGMDSSTSNAFTATQDMMIEMDKDVTLQIDSTDLPAVVSVNDDGNTLAIRILDDELRQLVIEPLDDNVSVTEGNSVTISFNITQPASAMFGEDFNFSIITNGTASPSDVEVPSYLLIRSGTTISTVLSIVVFAPTNTIFIRIRWIWIYIEIFGIRFFLGKITIIEVVHLLRLTSLQFEPEESVGNINVCAEVVNITSFEDTVTATIMADPFPDPASDTNDYSILVPNIMFSSGSDSGTACTSVSIIDDNIVESFHGFTISISSGDPSDFLMISDVEASVNITDNDNFTVSVQSAGSTSGSEGTLVTGQVQLSPTAGGTQIQIVATLETTVDTAQDDDITGGGTIQVTFDAGAGGPFTVDETLFTVSDDDIVEQDETVTIALSSTSLDSQLNAGNMESFTYTIIDSDAADLRIVFDPNFISLVEGETRPVELWLSSSNLTNLTLGIDLRVYLVSPDNVAGEGFSFSPNPFVLFPEMSVTPTCQEISITAEVDSIFEVTRQFSLNTSNSTVGTLDTASLTITINDTLSGVNVTFDDNSTDITVTEGERFYLCATLNGVTQFQAGLNEMISYEVIGDGLNLIEDTITFMSMTTSGCIILDSTLDGNITGSRTVTVRSTSGTLDVRSTNVTILEGDSLIVSLSPSSQIVDEEIDCTNIDVVVSVVGGGYILTCFYVTISFSNDSAFLREDYFVQNLTMDADSLDLHFEFTTATLMRTEILVIKIMNDSILECNETITAYVVNATSPINISGGKAVITVDDSADINRILSAVELVSASDSICEGDSTMVFLRSTPFEYRCDVSFTYTLQIDSSSSAVLGTDFNLTLEGIQTDGEISLIFPNSVIEGYIISNNLTVMADDDSVLEFNETIDISVSDVSGCGSSSLPQPSGGPTINIEDKEDACIVLTVDSTIMESAGYFNVCAEITGVMASSINLSLIITPTGADSDIIGMESFVIPAGCVFACAEAYPVTNNSDYNGPTTVTFSISSITPALPTVDISKTTSSTLLDPEDLIVNFAFADMSRGMKVEGGTIMVPVMVTSSGVLVNSVTVTVNVSVFRKSQGAILDLNGVTLTFVFTDASRTDTEDLSTDDNGIVQGDSIVTLAIRDSEDYTLGNFSVYEFELLDNDNTTVVIELFLQNNVSCFQEDDSGPLYICGRVVNASSVGNISVYFPLEADFDVDEMVIDGATVRPTGSNEIQINSLEFQLNFTGFYEEAVACAPFTIVSDCFIEFTEYFRVSVAASAHIDDINVISNQLDVIIKDSDIVTTRLVFAGEWECINITEGKDLENRFVQVCLELDGANGTEFEIDAKVVLNSDRTTATVGSDFSLSLVIPSGCPSSPFNEPPFFPEFRGMVNATKSRIIPSQDYFEVTFKPFSGSRACGVVTVFPDSESELVEKVVLEINGSSFDTLMSGNPNTSVIKIISDEDIVLQLLNSSISGSEGENLTICIVIANGTLSYPLEVSLSTASMDITFITSTFSFGMGSQAEDKDCIELSLNDDGIVEMEDEVADVILTCSPSVEDCAGDGFQITIRDTTTNDYSVVFNISTEEIPEGGAFQVCGSLSGTTPLETVIMYRYRIFDNAQATANIDFQPSPLPIVEFSSVGQVVCQTVTILEDLSLEGLHSFAIDVIRTGSTHPEISDETLFDQTITILDTDDGVLLFVNNPYQGCEGDVLTICLRLAGNDWCILESELTITLWSDGIVSGDIGQIPTVVFPATSLINTLVCVNVSLLNDSVAEDVEEKFSIYVSNVTQTFSFDEVPFPNVNVPQNGTIIISPIVADISLVNTSIVGTEGENITICVKLTIVKFNEALEVTLINFASNTSQTVTFEQNAPSGSLKCFDVPTMPDMCLEGDEEIRLGLSCSPSISECGPPFFNATIIDATNPSGVIVDFNISRTDVPEGETYSVCATLSGNVTVKRRIEFRLGCFPTEVAQADIDYSMPDLFVFDGSMDSVCQTLSVLDDFALEGPHSFALGSVTSIPTGITINDFDVEVNIIDTNTADLSFTEWIYQATEGSNISVCLRLGGNSWIMLQREVTVSLKSNSDDLDVLSPAIFPVAVYGINSIACAKVHVVSDMLTEDRQEFQLYVSSVTVEISDITVDLTNVMKPTKNATVVVAQSGSGCSISMSQSFLVTSEDMGTARICASLSNLQSGLEQSFTVYVQALPPTAEHTAKNGEDFNITDQEITFMPTNESSAEKCFYINILDDSILECNQSFILSLSKPTPPLCMLSQDIQTEVVIVDNDNELSLTIQGGGSVMEDFPDREICVKPLSDIQASVSVKVRLERGTLWTADILRNYTDLIISPSEPQMACFNVREFIKDDSVVESTENGSFVIDSASKNGVQLQLVNSDTKATIYVTDSDIAKVGFSYSAFNLTEGYPSKICLSYNADLEKELSLYVTVAHRYGDEDPMRKNITIGEGASAEFLIPSGRYCFNVTIPRDAIKEGLEFYDLTLFTNDTCVWLTQKSALGAVGGNGVVTLTVTANQTTVSESSGKVQICITADHAFEVPSFYVTLTTEDGTAVGGQDYVKTTKRVIFTPASGLQRCVHIPILNDECLEDKQESFNVTVTPGSDCVTLNKSEVQVYIEDDDDILVGFTTEGSIVKEGNSTEVCIQLCAGCLKRKVSFYVDTLFNGSAEYPMDVASNESRHITFNSTQTNYCLTIDIPSDDVVERTEFFALLLRSSDPYINFKPQVHVIQIEDCNTYCISLNQSMYTVREDQKELDVCVDVTGTFQQYVAYAFLDVVPMTAEGGGVDFAVNEQILQFSAAGQMCITVNISTDNKLENMEKFTVILRTRDTNAVLKQSIATVVILDNNTISVGFTQTVYTGIEDKAEDGGQIEVCITAMGAMLDREYIVSIYTMQSSAQNAAISGVDYDPTLARPMRIYLNSKSNRREYEHMGNMSCVNISLISDNIVEGNEVFIVALSSEDPAVRIFQIYATAEIIDNDAANVSLVVDSSASFEEDDKMLEACAKLVAGDLAVEVSVNISVDFQESLCPNGVNSTTTLTFADDSLVGALVCKNISIVEDVDVEDDEDFTITLERYTDQPPPVYIGPISMLSFTIVNDDYASISLVCEYLNVTESQGYVEVCAILNDGVLKTSVSVLVSTSYGTAGSEDFDALDAYKLSFDPLDPINTTRCVNITILDEDLVESDETFTVYLEAVGPVLIVPDINKTITIINDDYANVSLAMESYTFPEDVGSARVCAELVSGELGIDITAYMNTQCGTACSPNDFTSLINVPVMFKAGSSIGNLSCQYISIINDTITEDKENFTVALSASLPVVVYPTELSTIFIQDNDEIEVSLVQDFYTAEEGSNLTVCVQIDSGILGIQVYIGIMTDNGTAILGMDFKQPSDLVISFPPGSDSSSPAVCTIISIIDDSIDEFAEQFTVLLVSIHGNAVRIGIPSTAVVEIPRDPNDVVLVIGLFGSNTITEGENATFCVRIIEGVPYEDIFVQLQSSDIVATADNDYAPINANLTLGLSANESCTNLYTFEDNIYEDTEVLLLNITSVTFTAGMVEVRMPSLLVEILDNSEARFTLENVTDSICEAPVTLQPCLVSNIELGLFLEISVLVADMSTADISDYAGIPTNVVFAPGETVRCFTVTIIDDSVAEMCEETLMYSFSSNADRVTLPGPQQLIIRDNDVDTTIVDDTPIVSDDVNEFKIVINFTGCVASATCITGRNDNIRTFDCSPNDGPYRTNTTVGNSTLGGLRGSTLNTLTVTPVSQCPSGNIIEHFQNISRFRQGSDPNIIRGCTTYGINNGVEFIGNGMAQYDWRSSPSTIMDISQFMCRVRRADQTVVIDTTCTPPFTFDLTPFNQFFLPGDTGFVEVDPLTLPNCFRYFERFTKFVIP